MTWTDTDNERRIDLIDKESHGLLTDAESTELVDLTDRFHAWKRKVVPLPIKEATAAFRAMKTSADERERADFERWLVERHSASVLRDADGEYLCSVPRALWACWLARAALDRGMPPLVDVPEPGEQP
jgi:hypothetical protein